MCPGLLSPWSSPAPALAHLAPQKAAHEEEQGKEKGEIIEPNHLLGYISVLCRGTLPYQNCHFSRLPTGIGGWKD